MATKNTARSDVEYLQNFNRLGPQVYLYEPTTSTTRAADNTTTNPPDLTILCTWMGAATKHINKYTESYVAKYPSTSILLVRSELPDLTWRPTGQQVQRLKPAVSAIRRLVDTNSPRRIRVLLHTFSNGGSWTACVLATAYKLAARVQDANLPVSAMTMDSAPSLPRARLAYDAMTETLGKSVMLRIVGGYFVWMLIMVSWVLDNIGYRQNILIKMRAKLNDTSEPFLGGGIPRLYMCSLTDRMVPMEDVVAHAEAAKDALRKDGVDDVQNVVTVEEFKGSHHVGHMMVDKERYWRLVAEVWVKADV